MTFYRKQRVKTRLLLSEVRSIIITVTSATSGKLDYNKRLFPRLKLAIIIEINDYNDL